MHRLTSLAVLGLASLISGFGRSRAQTTKHYEPYYLPSSAINFAAVLQKPPAPGSPAQNADLAAVQAAEHNRTSAQVKQAKADDLQEDIFLYATVLGPKFKAETFPQTAMLSSHLRNDVGVVSPPIKVRYNRPRPFVTDSSVHAVCEKKTEGSYPSGHATVGYLTGLVLAQMLPERADDILARADAYAQDRIICGVHYPTDIQASKALALVMLGQIETSERFQGDLQAASQEIRAALQLPIIR